MRSLAGSGPGCAGSRGATAGGHHSGRRGDRLSFLERLGSFRRDRFAIGMLSRGRDSSGFGGDSSGFGGDRFAFGGDSSGFGG
ncbi:MAG TPA: hypothetical protein VF942_14100, partial [Acidimicrobiales bacterium]